MSQAAAAVDVHLFAFSLPFTRYRSIAELGVLDVSIKTHDGVSGEQRVVVVVNVFGRPEGVRHSLRGIANNDVCQNVESSVLSSKFSPRTDACRIFLLSSSELADFVLLELPVVCDFVLVAAVLVIV